MDNQELPKKEYGVNPLTGHKMRVDNLRPNRKGRPAGVKNKTKTALDRMKKDPAQELIVIAQLLRTCPPEDQRKALESEMKIWMELLEYQKAKKKAVNEKAAPEASKKAAEATFDLMKELEKEFDGTQGSDGTSAGETNNPSTGPEEKQ